MLDLPQTSIGDIARLADWVELSVLSAESNTVSQADVCDALRDSGMIGSPSEYFQEDALAGPSDALGNDEEIERFTELIWDEIAVRARAVGSAYPISISKDLLSRLASTWQDSISFVALALADLGRHYPDSSVDIEPDSTFTRLFEKIVEACMRGITGGACARFGWPRDPEWPTSIEDRIVFLGNALSIQPENLAGKVDSKDKDRGLDVVARLRIGSEGPGTLMFLTQCATGKNWKSKRGEPSLAQWRDIYQWKSVLVRAVAIPWRLESNEEISRTHRHFDDAVVLDRIRLLSGNPDSFLDPRTRESILDWCKVQLTRLPPLRAS